MSKKFMIAVDDSIHSKNAVAYAIDLRKTLGDVNFTLVNIQPTISQYLLDEARTKPQALAELEKVNKKNADNSEALLEKYRSQMVATDIPTKNIHRLSGPRKLGVAKDILDAGKGGKFDAIIMGRRGLSNLQEVFIGSVSANVVNNSKDTSVWLVDGKGRSRDIMVAVDGSESSYKAVAHLAHIVGGHPDVKLLFFHVAPRLKDFCPVDFEEAQSDSLEEIILQSDEQCIDQFYAHAKKLLKDAGIQDNQVDYKTGTGVLRIGKMIMDAYLKGDFGTLVVGRRGVNRKYFTGSVSRYLLNHFSDGALWMVP